MPLPPIHTSKNYQFLSYSTAKLRFFHEIKCIFSIFLYLCRQIMTKMKQWTKITTMLLAFTAMMVLSCKEQQVTRHNLEADSLINSAYQSRNYDSIVILANRHQQEGTISGLKACYWRGYAYSRLRKMRMAELEWREALAQHVASNEDLEFYAQSANRLAGLLYLKTEYSGAIRIAIPAMNLLKEREYTMTNDYANLQAFVGSCQLKLGHLDEASNNFTQALQHYREVTDANRDMSSYTSAVVGIVTIVDAYIMTNHYREANEWTEHLDSMLQQCQQHPKARKDYIDKQRTRLCLYRACALEGLGRKTEAAKAYKEALGTEYAKSGDGKLEATSYLMAAHRWNEAAENFQVMDAQFARYDFSLTMEAIETYMLKKYLANVEAHRIDSAIAVGTLICHALDSAITWQKRDDAAELATIYEIQQKDSELMEQRASLSDQRLLMAFITLVLVTLGFGLFIFFRHRAAMRLEAAYYDLERANVRAEESSRMKSDFIQQISHEIRTPLNILSGFTQLLTTPGMTYDEATLDDIKQKITDNTDRITGLVNKMLELSEAKSHAVIDCNDRVSAVQIAAEAANASGITNAGHLTFDMQITPEAESIMLQTNQPAAVRSLSLLLDNARKFTAPPESRQQEKPADHQQKVVLRLTVSAGRLFFSVEDTGIGIPHKEAERIFDEFVQLDEYYDGTGIGLTVARSLARRIGGDIILDTAYIGGSRFVMLLPVDK
jgi:signal transduction histidine kinase